MKILGFLTLAIGILGIIAALGMDTSVASYGGRVINLGLMNEKQNLIIVFVAVAIAGVFILTRNRRIEQATPSPVSDRPKDTVQVTRTCPYCAESIKAQAILCRYCDRESVPSLPSTDESLTSKNNLNEPVLDKNRYEILVRFVNCIKGVYSQALKIKTIVHIRNGLDNFLLRVESHLDSMAIFLFFFGIIGGVYSIFFGNHYPQDDEVMKKLHLLIHAATISFAGLIIYSREVLAKEPASLDAHANNIADQSDGKINLGCTRTLFGKTIDIAVFQAVMVISIWMLHSFYYDSLAYAFAIIVLAIGYFLIKIGMRTYGYITSFSGLSYILFRHFMFNELEYIQERLQEALSGYPLFSMTPYLFILIASVAIPHTQFVRLSSLRYGKLRGDLSFVFLGHEIFLPLVSALVFYVLWLGISATVGEVYNLSRMIFW